MYTDWNAYSISTSHYIHFNVTHTKILVKKTNMEVLLTINI